MCGIYAAISSSPRIAHSSDLLALPVGLRRCLCNRGPDYFGQVATDYDLGDGRTAKLAFTSTVLALRGDHVTQQPFNGPESGSVLCWNGEAWKIQGNEIRGNDGEAVFKLLRGAAGAYSPQGSPDRRIAAILDALRAIEGPFAFIYFDQPAGRVYFGRDRLGRRSLLTHHDGPAGRLTLSSIAETADPRWREVEADGIYVMDLETSSAGETVDGLTARIARYDWVNDGDMDLVSGIGRFNTSLPAGKPTLTAESPSVRQLRDRLTESLSLRILNVPVPPGLDDSHDTQIAILFSGGLDCTVLARLSHDLLPPSQGVDLINVAFENPRVAAQLGKQVDIYEACPDRITGRKSFAELQSVCPGRAWRFLAVNVPYTETVSHRSQVISLIYPHNTEMDLSIAYALYFAARGQGMFYESSDPDAPPSPGSTPARVLLSGLGADELFGGYIRHETAFSRRGYTGLIEELKFDVARLGKRNLGRDDRVMAHWGREVRFPYLDEELVRWAVECPTWEKCDFENAGEGKSDVEPAKRVLRLLAVELSIAGAAREKKRAIQFGSRTAKMESGKVKGTALISEA